MGIVLCAVALVVSLPFVVIHLQASPDDAPISPLQHGVAAMANFVGPWGVAVVRLVDFPNAGMRSFSWPLAVGMTLMGAVVLVSALSVRIRTVQVFLAVVWFVFLVGWFVVGLGQIADGLL
jgi:hypothetical protein